MNGENFGVSLIISLCACLGKSSDTKSEPQNSVKGSGAGLRLLAVTPESRGRPGGWQCIASAKRSFARPCPPLGLLLSSTDILGCTRCFSGGLNPAVLISRGKVSPLRVTESLRGPQTVAFKKFSDSGQDHVFRSCKTQVGTLSSNQGWYPCLCTQISENGKRFISVGRIKER